MARAAKSSTRIVLISRGPMLCTAVHCCARQSVQLQCRCVCCQHPLVRLETLGDHLYLPLTDCCSPRREPCGTAQQRTRRKPKPSRVLRTHAYVHTIIRRSACIRTYIHTHTPPCFCVTLVLCCSISLLYPTSFVSLREFRVFCFKLAAWGPDVLEY